MDAFLEILEHSYLGNTTGQWLIAGCVVLLILGTTLFLRRFIRRSYARMAQTEHTEFMEVPLHVASRTTLLFLLILSVFAALMTLDLPSRLRATVQTILTIAVFWQAGVWISTAALAWIERKRRTSLVEDRAAVGTLGIIAVIVRVLIWVVVLLLTLDNLGINITALVAGLGIGGIAVALAVQNVLGDVLASLSITLDKPFVVGDFLIIGEFMGSVEYIGIKSTRLRSLTGEQIIMSNADLLSSRVRNYGRMSERRVVFTLSVTYETPREKLQKIAGTVRGIIESQSNIRFDRCHFARFGPASLDYEAVYYVLSADFNQYMDIQQAISFRILEAFETEGIEFAYPTQKLWLAGPGKQSEPDPQAE